MTPLESVPPAGFHGTDPHYGELLLTAIAASGGVAKYLHEMARGKKPFKLLGLVGKALVSAFVGWAAAHLAISWDMKSDMVIVFAAIFGWLGADGAEMMIKYVKARFSPPS